MFSFLSPTQSPHTLLIINAISTWVMVGVIWLIQLVHYPLLAYVGEAGFTAYTLRHTQWITWLVGPVMLTEALTAVLLLYYTPAIKQAPLLLSLGIVLLLVIWAATALLSVPCHEVLTKTFNLEVIHRLTNTNWVRTVGWSLRGVLLAYLLFQALKTTHVNINVLGN